MQQTLPNVQRHGGAFDREFAAVIEPGFDIANVKRWAKILPAGLDLRSGDRQPGRRFNFLQQRRTPFIQMRQSQTQAAHQQRDNDNQCDNGEQ